MYTSKILIKKKHISTGHQSRINGFAVDQSSLQTALSVDLNASHSKQPTDSLPPLAFTIGPVHLRSYNCLGQGICLHLLCSSAGSVWGLLACVALLSAAVLCTLQPQSKWASGVEQVQWEQMCRFTRFTWQEWLVTPCLPRKSMFAWKKYRETVMLQSQYIEEKNKK